jgi:hypothetical protein
MPNLICSRSACGQEFYSKHSTAKFCGRRCAGIANMAKPGAVERQRAAMRKFTDEELLERLISKARELGRTPSKRELGVGSNFTKRFGSYNRAVIAAGLSPNVAFPSAYLERERHLVPLSMRFRVLARDGFRCQYCGGTPQDGYVLHVDHKVPVSRGGPTEMENLVTACHLCNSGKSDHVFPEGDVAQWQSTKTSAD